MDIGWIVTGWTLMGLGLLGLVLPVLPGPLLLWLGTLAFSAGTGWERPWVWTHFFTGTIMVLAHGAQWIAAVVGARLGGGSKVATIGALLGMVVGLAGGPPGLILGPLAGAVCAELIFANRPFPKALQAGVGAAVGVAAGLVGQIVFSVGMICVFVLMWFVGN